MEHPAREALTMAKTSKVEHEMRLLETEQLMIRVVNPAQIRYSLVKKHGVQEATVDTWMSTVRKRWEKDVAARSAAMPEVREERRLQMRQMLYDAIAQANARRKVVRDRGGKVMLDPQTGEPITKPDPDLKSALTAMNQLRELDALDMPKSAHLLVGNTSGANEDGTMSDEELEFFYATARYPTAAELETWRKSR